MAKEPEQLGNRLRGIEDRLLELEDESNVLHAIWECVTVPLLGMVAATPAHRPALEAMVDRAEQLADQCVVEDRQHRFRRLFALLRTHLLDADGPDPSI